MAAEIKKGRFLDRIKERIAAQADAIKERAGMVFKEKAAELREAIGPDKERPVKEPARAFGPGRSERDDRAKPDAPDSGPGRDWQRRPPAPVFGQEGGEDVKQIVWTSHTVENASGQRFFGAVGITDSGYYRTAEVQSFGPDEMWQWKPELQLSKNAAINTAESLAAHRLSENTAPKSIEDMAEIPDSVKRLADAAVEKAGAEKMSVQNIQTPPVPDWKDTQALEAQQAQKRLDAQKERQPEPPKGPDKA